MKPPTVIQTHPPTVATAQPVTAVPASAPAKDPKKNKFKMNLMSSLNFGAPAAGKVAPTMAVSVKPTAISADPPGAEKRPTPPLNPDVSAKKERAAPTEQTAPLPKSTAEGAPEPEEMFKALENT